MDGSPPVEHEDHALRCAVCGYPRTGLPDGAPCPECGTAPAATIGAAGATVGAARTRAEQAWLVSVGLGLALLVVASFFAIQSELYLGLGGITLVAINAPGPKLSAAAILLREIGNPQERGVQGVMAALGQLLAVWLVTEPMSRHADDAAETSERLRRAARWTTIVTFGLFFGATVSGFDLEYAHLWGWHAMPAIVVAAAFVELPSNVLLYAHLARLSRRFDPSPQSRSMFGLSRAAALVGAACAVGAVLTVCRAAAQDKPVVAWRCAQAAYGALALGAGTMMTVSVIRLGWQVLIAAIDRPSRRNAAILARLAPAIGRLAARVRAEPTRWAAVAGLLLWLWCCRPLVMNVLWFSHRQGLGGDLPTMNFIGPKLWAVPLLSERYGSWYEDAPTWLIPATVAVWLITAFRPTGSARLATLARWVPTVLVGLTFGVGLAIQRANAEVRQSHWVAAATMLVEAPSTLVVYLFLARLARSSERPDLSRLLGRMAAIATAVILAPLAFFALPSPLRIRHATAAVVAAEIAYGALTLAAGIVAWALVVRLTWALAAGPKTPKGQPASS